jgi:hypothetical protein
MFSKYQVLTFFFTGLSAFNFVFEKAEVVEQGKEEN